MEPQAQEAFLGLVRRLGHSVDEVQLPPGSHEALDMHRTLMEADIAASFDPEYRTGPRPASRVPARPDRAGRATTPAHYQRALDHRTRVAEALDALAGRYDAILTPATLGTAPAGLDSTGDPVMCTLWTFTGQPAISLPLLHAASGLPLGVQLVGRRDDDARLLRTAQWLAVAGAATGDGQ